jgi:hypothetical protein
MRETVSYSLGKMAEQDHETGAAVHTAGNA